MVNYITVIRCARHITQLHYPTVKHSKVAVRKKSYRRYADNRDLGKEDVQYIEKGEYSKERLV